MFCWATDKSSRVGCQPSAQLATLTVNQLFSGVLRNFSPEVKGGKNQEDLLITAEQSSELRYQGRMLVSLVQKRPQKDAPEQKAALLVFLCPKTGPLPTRPSALVFQLGHHGMSVRWQQNDY